MYRMNQSRGITSRQRMEMEAHERILNRRNAMCESCGDSHADMDSHDNSCQHDNCACGDYSANDFNHTLAMVYSPVQEWQNLYCEEEGFMEGTIFKELNKPFYGPKCTGGSCRE